MSVLLAKNWWSLVIRGVAAIALGVITFAHPGLSLGALVLVFGFYALIDGLVKMAGAVRAITIAWPAITALSLVYVVAAWALVTGVFEIMAAVRLRKHVSGEWLLALSGFASLILGILMIAVPLAGALAIALWVGAYAFVFGALLIGLGLRLRAWSKAHEIQGGWEPAPAR